MRLWDSDSFLEEEFCFCFTYRNKSYYWATVALDASRQIRYHLVSVHTSISEVTFSQAQIMLIYFAAKLTIILYRPFLYRVCTDYE